MTWKADAPLDTEATYLLCRCGQSDDKPFCDNSHRDHDWSTDENLPEGTYDERARRLGHAKLTVTDDAKLCMHAGQCGHAESNIWKMLKDAKDDTVIRAQIVRMVENCPSGRLGNIIDGVAVEPSLPAEIGVVDGGPYWVTGGVPTDAESGPMETRNRVTLCRCGASEKKPLCDGSHKKIEFEGIS